jgi:hypothetical protein
MMGRIDHILSTHDISPVTLVRIKQRVPIAREKANAYSTEPSEQYS